MTTLEMKTLFISFITYFHLWPFLIVKFQLLFHWQLQWRDKIQYLSSANISKSFKQLSVFHFILSHQILTSSIIFPICCVNFSTSIFLSLTKFEQRSKLCSTVHKEKWELWTLFWQNRVRWVDPRHFDPACFWQSLKEQSWSVLYKVWRWQQQEQEE